MARLQVDVVIASPGSHNKLQLFRLLQHTLVYNVAANDHRLSGMFRRSASLAIPHLKSFAAIPSMSLVQLGNTNRSVFLSHESQREIALV